MQSVYYRQWGHKFETRSSHLAFIEIILCLPLIQAGLVIHDPLQLGQLSVTGKCITTVSAGKLLCDAHQGQHDKISKNCDRAEIFFKKSPFCKSVCFWSLTKIRVSS